MNQLKEKFYRFMYGKYGMDNLGRFLMFCSITILLVSSIFNITNLVYFAIPILGIVYFRLLSKNHQKRFQENQIYLKISNRILHFLRIGAVQRSITQFFKYHIFKCPKCNQKIRVPRGKGKIAIRCPKCGQEFIKKS